ncbi:MAG: conjugal transfer protein TraI [Sphingobacteriales bacterium]|nr:conjugal transfer protein TraI [Sphingobacteriales bacterium]MBI3717498.1 conjugal transfer protein TraI [Sphingobacteriales bacterium]
MKKLLILAGIILSVSIAPVQQAKAQIPIIDIIKAAVKKVIRAADLKIQRLQNKTIWLQNAQKTLENKMSKLKLTEISDWSKKQKELYAKYFDELWKVKNVIGSYQAVREIIKKQIQLVQEYSKAFNLAKQDKNFTAKEINYMQEVYTGILDESLKNIDQVQLVINAFITQMSDARRLDIIHAAGNNIEQNITDLRQFNHQNIIISLQRSKERNDIEVVKKLYGLE